GLGAGERPAVALGAGDGLHALEVGAGAGLRHRDGGDRLARYHAGQIAPLLLFRTVGDQIVGDDIALEREAGGRAEIGQFLTDDGVESEVAPRPAIGFRHAWTKQPGRTGGGPGLALDDSFLLVALEIGLERVGEHPANGIAEGLVAVVEDGTLGRLDHLSFPFSRHLVSRRYGEGEAWRGRFTD